MRCEGGVQIVVEGVAATPVDGADEVFKPSPCFGPRSNQEGLV